VGKERSSVFVRKPAGDYPDIGRRRHRHTPVLEPLECRQLLAASAVSAVEQYGVPSVFAIDNSGNVAYNFLTIKAGAPAWNGWTAISAGGGTTAIATGSVLVTPFLRPYIFAISENNVYYNYINGSETWNGWSPVGMGVGAKAISSGVIPIVNEPYVVMTNGNNDVFYNYQVSNGSWAGWSVVGAGVGALSVSTGVVQASLSPAIYEPYVFMINGLNDVYYKVRNTNGSWTGWSPVGVGVGAAAISAVTVRNQPFVSMQNGAGDIFLNGENPNGSWLGWAPVGAGTSPGPAVAMSAVVSDSGINEFALTGAGQVYSSYGIYLHWNPWIGLGSLATGVSAESLSVSSDPATAPFAFVVGSDGNVYWSDQPRWATWSTWASIGAPT
jgi:hypothetical protein